MRHAVLQRPHALAILAAVLLAPATARAWWNTGHELVAQIAQNRMSATTRSEVDHLLEVPLLYPGDLALSLRTQTMVSVAPWADAIKTTTWHSESQQKFFSSCHFVDSPIQPDVPPSSAGAALALQQGLEASPGENVVYAIRSAIKVLSSVSSEGARALALRFLVHFAGDIHQPLHCSDPLVGGASTAGGNGLPLLSTLYVAAMDDDYSVDILGDTYDSAAELHALWDAAGGAFVQVVDATEVGSERDLPIVEAVALEIEETHAGAFVAEIEEPSTDAWALGSTELAMSVFQTPVLLSGSPACSSATCYVINQGGQTRVAERSRDRIYVGGRRLARLLDALFDRSVATAAYLAYVDSVVADPDVGDIYSQLLPTE